MSVGGVASFDSGVIEDAGLTKRNSLLLLHAQISVQDASQFLKSANVGGLCMFEGTTRNSFEGREVANLAYEAYSVLAMRTLSSIARETREKHPELVNIVLWHRLGQVSIAETSVIIGASSPHRQACMQAVEFMLEKIKQRLEVWKYETYVDSSSGSWKVNKDTRAQV